MHQMLYHYDLQRRVSQANKSQSPLKADVLEVTGNRRGTAFEKSRASRNQVKPKTSTDGSVEENI